jgi:hypothetical protein
LGELEGEEALLPALSLSVSTLEALDMEEAEATRVWIDVA